MVISNKLNRILKLFRDVNIRLGLTSGKNLSRRYPALATAKLSFPNSGVIQELECFPELLAFKQDLKSNNAIFFVILIETKEQLETKLLESEKFKKLANVDQILILFVESPIENTESDYLLDHLEGFWIRDQVRKPLRSLLEVPRKKLNPRRPQRRKVS